MQDKKTKSRGGNNNPAGKGGFKDNPQNRNENGQRAKEVVAFNRSLRALIVEYGEQKSDKEETMTRVQQMIKQVWVEAEDGTEWAVNWIAERVEGKVTQPISFGKMTDAELRDFIAQQLGAIGSGISGSE